MVMNDLGETLVQNPLAVALLGDERRYAGGRPRRSRIYRWFTDADAARAWHPAGEHDRLSRSYAAALHIAMARHPDDAHGRALVAALGERSPEFAMLWAEHDVSWRMGVEPKTHPAPAGRPMELECQLLID